jgi:purine-cytosine permease-like protein
MQLVGWTTFEIMIMARAASLLAWSVIPYNTWAAIFGALVALLGIAGPLAVARQWLGKFVVWIALGSSTVIIATLLMSPGAHSVIYSQGKDMSFFTALDLVIACRYRGCRLWQTITALRKRARARSGPR